MVKITYRAYHHDTDAQPIYELWQTAFASTWPLTPGLLRRGLSAPMPTQRQIAIVACDTSREPSCLIGVVAAQLNRRQDSTVGGNITTLIVAPEYRRQGIGKRLLELMLDTMRAEGVNRVQLGGLYPRIWPGIPEDLTEAVAFFKACGWEFEERIQTDLVGNLTNYTISDELRERMAKERITLGPATSEDVPAILALHEREFAGWVNTYRHVAALGDYDDFLVARDPNKGIIGSLIMCSPHSHPTRSETIWTQVLGENMGSMGEVGVAASERGRGIGLALVVWGAEVLWRRGVGNCLIGWTTLVDFYGKAGFKAWRQYLISRRTL